MYTINLVPIPASRPRIPRYGKAYYTEPYNSYKKQIKVMLKSFGLEKIPKPRAVWLQIIFYMPIPKSTSKKKALEMVGSYHVKKPDTDNLIKALKDGLSDIGYDDDSQVSVEYTVKKYDTEPRTEFILKELFRC